MPTYVDRGRRWTVAVRPGRALAARRRLLAALEAAFPVDFRPLGESRSAPDALVALGDVDPARAADPLPPGIPALVLTAGDDGATSRPVRLAESDSVDPRLRGMTLADPLAGPDPSATGHDEEVLAVADAGPVWTASRGPVPVHRIRSSLPELGSEQSLRELLAERPLSMVGLLQFLRGLCVEAALTPPPLRAAILFDDPNLRWRTYGFIDYRKLLADADEHGYHAAMAMIPLDAWRQHRKTVALFRERRDRLSLVLHGNNHASRELMHPRSDAGALAIAAQAMRRAGRFEARYGLRMDRVMTPPHGMCSAPVARALGALGYDALCAIHPLPWGERVPANRPLAGWEPAEFASGCAVIPRVPLDTPISELALRAFLDQPLILYGHHEDLADGLDRLGEIAAAIGRLGDVRWASIGEIAATNYSTLLEGGTLRVRPHAHRVRVAVPEGAASILVELPSGTENELAGWSARGSPNACFDSAAPCEAGEAEIRLRSSVGIDPASVPSPSPRVWPILRRAATETRDRLSPLLQTGST